MLIQQIMKQSKQKLIKLASFALTYEIAQKQIITCPVQIKLVSNNGRWGWILCLVEENQI